MALTAGSRLGPYEIVSLLGAGGMGEVYLARDPRLKREIAIKVLPDATAADPERRARLKREAQSIAALSHPNIVTIYSVEDVDGVLCLTMEYVDGRRLSDLIVKGGLPLTQILKVAIPLADALSSAHQKGITHRDLKPANVMIGADGRVKVLDFGLAKLLEPSSDDLGITGLPTASLTGEGRIVGTVAYMSPEQAEGKPVDARSDLFSLGVILYEMATGQRPFTGDTSISVISSIVRDTPTSVTELNPALPRELARVVRRALAKDPELRYQTAKDLRNDLTDLQQELSSGSLQAPIASPRARSTAGRWKAIGVVAAAILAVRYATWQWRAAPTGSAIPRNVTFEQLTTQTGVKRFPSLSPDGKWVVYEGNQSGNADVYLQGVGGQNAINLTRDSPDDDTEPAFSPDGERIAFRSERQGGGIFVMGRTGESVRRLTDVGHNPAWSPDATRIVYGTDDAHVLGRKRFSELWIVVVATGEKRRIFEGDAVQPSWSPHGLRIAFWKSFGEQQGQRDIFTIPAAGGTPVPVTSDPAIDWNPVWSPDGHFLLFSSDRGGTMNLWRVPIDERTGATLDAPEALGAPSSSAALMSISADGRSVGYTSFTTNQTIERVALDPATGSILGEPVTVISGSRLFEAPRASPDGRWLTFNNFGPQMEIFVSGADGSGIRQLTNDRVRNRFPQWSPDGSQIAFMSNRDGKTQIWSIKPDGSSLRRLTDSRTGAGGFGWSPDGLKLAFRGLEPPDDSKLFLIDPRADWKDQRPMVISTIIEPGIRFSGSSWSPEGQQLVGIAAPPGEDYGSLVVYSFATRRFTRVYESKDTHIGFFLNDGRRILFQEKFNLMLIDSETRAVRELMSNALNTVTDSGGAAGLAWLTRDNRTIYFVRHVEQADIWLMRLK
jgi:eukaryotic-like serine/threonine-protein kinase